MILFYFTIFHSLIALVALGAGLTATVGLLGGRASRSWTPLFLATAVGTTATGFMFPLPGLSPAVLTGLAASVVFAAMLIARLRRFAGVWRAIYKGGFVAQVYFLAFVAVAQAFTKVPMLQAAAPTLSEPPFAACQAAVLAVFVGLGLAAVRGRRAPAAA